MVNLKQIGLDLFIPIAFLTQNAAASNSYNWQKLGACGVPSTTPNIDLFDDIPVGRTGARQPRNMRGAGGNSRLAATKTKSKQTKLSQPSKLERIVGGKIALPNTWPWQVYISVCGRWYGNMECNICGGSIVSPDWIISAAHCVPVDATGWVYYGTHNLGRPKAKVHIAEFKQHPNWSLQTFDHDISVIRTIEPMKITNEASPICLPHKTTCFETHTACVVTGFGLTSENGGFPDRLREVAVRLMAKSRCTSYPQYAKILTDNMFCAGYTEGLRDACAGDSGGPLVCRLPGNNAWILHGVVSWGYGCARQENPGVYTQVTNMLDFLEDVTGLTVDSNLANIDENGNDKGCWKVGNTEVEWQKQSMSNSLIASTYNATNDWKQSLEDEESALADGKQTQCNYERTNTNGYYRWDNMNGRRSGSSGEIKTENYPGLYPKNSHCTWTITNEESEVYVRLVISPLKVECRTHGGDKLTIKSLYNDKSYVLCKIRKMVTLNDGSGFVIDFKSDSNREYPGFKIKFNYQDMTFMCNENLPKQSSGVVRTNKNYYSMGAGMSVTNLATENWPRKYSKKSQCRWHFSKREDDGNDTKTKFKITVDKMKLELKNNICNKNNDNLYILASPDCATTSLVTNVSTFEKVLCGNPKRQPVVIYAHDICIVFKADGDKYRGNGMTFKVEVVDA